MNYFKHATSEISPKASIGQGTYIWNNAQIREGARVGSNCRLAKNVYIDTGVIIGNNVKIQNNASIFQGVIIEDGVFVGPHVCFTNDRFPRAINKDGTLKSSSDWAISKTLVKEGASIGANSTILPELVIGKYAMIGAGSVVTKDVADHTLVLGNPAKVYSKIDKSGNKVNKDRQPTRGNIETHKDE